MVTRFLYLLLRELRIFARCVALHRKFVSTLSWILLAIALHTSAAHSQEITDGATCAPPTIRTDVRPDPKGPPTKVALGLRMIDLREISDVDQTLTVDIAVRMDWTDPRLANLEGCTLPVSEVWFPELVLLNSGRVFNRWPDLVSIGKGGQVIYLQRVSGTFSSLHTLEEFPFGIQSIELVVHPLHWSEAKLQFQLNETFAGARSKLNISDWRVLDVSSEIVSSYLPALEASRSTYVFTIHAKRYTSYYILKIVAPICMIVIMSWTVFWINPKNVGTRIGLSATSVLTIVAFIFATTNMLPRLGYFTLLDEFIAVATAIIFLALIQSVLTSYLVQSGRMVAAVRMDRVNWFAFPILFALYCLMLYLRVKELPTT